MARSKFIIDDDIIDDFKNEEVSIKPVRKVEQESSKVTEKKEKPVKKPEVKKEKSEPKKEVVKPEPKITPVKEIKIQSEKKVNITLKLTDEQKDYLAMQSAVTGQPLFQTVISITNDCIKAGYKEDNLIKSFRNKEERKTSIKTMHIPDDFRTEVRIAAIKFKLKPITLIEYAIEKARQETK